MKHFVITLVVCLASGCTSKTKDAPKPITGEVIIETGYIVCTTPSEDCSGVASCSNDSEKLCVFAPAEECTNELTCACVGAWTCGTSECEDVAGGFKCLIPTYGGCETPDGGVEVCVDAGVIECHADCRAYADADVAALQALCDRAVECGYDRRDCTLRSVEEARELVYHEGLLNTNIPPCLAAYQANTACRLSSYDCAEFLINYDDSGDIPNDPCLITLAQENEQCQW